MTRNAQTKFLAETLEELERAMRHLRYSAQACGGIGDNPSEVTEEELIFIESHARNLLAKHAPENQ